MTNVPAVPGVPGPRAPGVLVLASDSFRLEDEIAEADLVVSTPGGERGVIQAALRGKRVALVNPGHRLVGALLDVGVAVRAAPGASPVIAALAVSGLPTERFCVESLPARSSAGPDERRSRLTELATEQRTLVLTLVGAPGRAAGLLADAAGAFGDRPAALMMEDGQVRRASLTSLAVWASEQPVRGELTLVVAGAVPVRAAAPAPDDLAALVAHAQADGLSRRDAITAVAKKTGAPRRDVYAAAHARAGATT